MSRFRQDGTAYGYSLLLNNELKLHTKRLMEKSTYARFLTAQLYFCDW